MSRVSALQARVQRGELAVQPGLLLGCRYRWLAGFTSCMGPPCMQRRAAAYSLFCMLGRACGFAPTALMSSRHAQHHLALLNPAGTLSSQVTSGPTPSPTPCEPWCHFAAPACLIAALCCSQGTIAEDGGTSCCSDTPAAVPCPLHAWGAPRGHPPFDSPSSHLPATLTALPASSASASMDVPPTRLLCAALPFICCAATWCTHPPAGTPRARSASATSSGTPPMRACCRSPLLAPR